MTVEQYQQLLQSCPESCKILPSGYQVVEAGPYGSGSKRTTRVRVRTSNEKIKCYFIKEAITDDDCYALERQMVALEEMSKLDQDLVPHLRTREREGRGREKDEGERRTREREGRGREKDDKSQEERDEEISPLIYQTPPRFLVMDFLVIEHMLPSPKLLSARIATVHRNSVSPREGHFGFPRFGPHSHSHQGEGWSRSWAKVFGDMLRRTFDETKKQGIWNAGFQKDFMILVDQTVPVLLEALQSEGRTLKPCLVHGNLSTSNMGINMETGKLILISPCGLYAHNEYELGSWRRKSRTLRWSYFREYQLQFPPSEPYEQWDDRITLYSIKFNLSDVLETMNAVICKKIVEDTTYLITKYKKPSTVEESETNTSD